MSEKSVCMDAIPQGVFILGTRMGDSYNLMTAAFVTQVSFNPCSVAVSVANNHYTAELIAQQLRQIYPLPNQVTTRATTSLGEVRQPRFPSVLVEIGYHDNYEDAVWVEGHLDAIAQQLARALTEFFGLPFIYPMTPVPGTVAIQYGTLNLRDYPSSDGAILENLPAGSTVTVYGEWEGWYVVHYEGYVGYAAAAYIDIG